MGIGLTFEEWLVGKKIPSVWDREGWYILSLAYWDAMHPRGYPRFTWEVEGTEDL